MSILVVPMDPAFLPEAALLTGGVFTGVAALVFLATRRARVALRFAVASLACFALVFASVRTLHRPPQPRPQPLGPRIRPDAPSESTATIAR